MNRGVYSSLERLRTAPDSGASSSSSDGEWEDPSYAPGTQKTRVAGEVLRWHHETGAEAIPAVQYMESLEQEVRMLRQQVRPSSLTLILRLTCLVPHAGSPLIGEQPPSC